MRQKHFEDLRDRERGLQVDKLELTTALAQSKTERDSVKSDIDTVKEERSRLHEEIAQVRLQLLNSPIPHISATEREASKLRALEAANASQKKKLDNVTADFDFTKQQYQEASAAFAELNAEHEALKAEQPDLRRRAAAEMSKLKAMNRADENAALRSEADALREECRAKDRLIQKQHDEIRDMKRGRGGVQTRGSSVQPRSPRGGSRGGSPAASLLGPGGKPASALSGRFK